MFHCWNVEISARFSCSYQEGQISEKETLLERYQEQLNLEHEDAMENGVSDEDVGDTEDDEDTDNQDDCTREEASMSSSTNIHDLLKLERDLKRKLRRQQQLVEEQLRIEEKKKRLALRQKRNEIRRKQKEEQEAQTPPKTRSRYWVSLLTWTRTSENLGWK